MKNDRSRLTSVDLKWNDMRSLGARLELLVAGVLLGDAEAVEAHDVVEDVERDEKAQAARVEHLEVEEAEQDDAELE